MRDQINFPNLAPPLFPLKRTIENNVKNSSHQQPELTIMDTNMDQPLPDKVPAAKSSSDKPIVPRNDMDEKKNVDRDDMKVAAVSNRADLWI